MPAQIVWAFAIGLREKSFPSLLQQMMAKESKIRRATANPGATKSPTAHRALVEPCRCSRNRACPRRRAGCTHPSTDLPWRPSPPLPLGPPLPSVRVARGIHLQHHSPTGVLRSAASARKGRAGASTRAPPEAPSRPPSTPPRSFPLACGLGRAASPNRPAAAAELGRRKERDADPNE